MHSTTAPQACRNWAFLGRCDYGDSCPYVHSSFSPLDSSGGGGPLTGVLASMAGEFRPMASSFHHTQRVFSGGGGGGLLSSGVGGLGSTTLGAPLNQDLLVSALNQRERILSTSPFLLPELIQNKYHSLLLLDSSSPQSLGSVRTSQTLGKLRTACYKALSGAGSAAVVCLRRVEGFMHLSNYDLVQETVSRWTSGLAGGATHPNVVALRSAFVTQEFQECEGYKDLGGSLVWVYDYVDQAVTLEQYLTGGSGSVSGSGLGVVTEQLFMDVLLQGLSGLAFVHGHGLAVRAIAASKILLSGPQFSRVHLNCVGLMDVLQPPSVSARGPLREAQLQDLTAFARVLDELRPSTSTPQLLLSETVQQVVADLMAAETKGVTAAGLAERLGTAYAARLSESQSQTDLVMGEYRKCVDMGRSVDLLFKVNAVADRPSLFDDWRWAGTGDRYIVSLFRDYLFFQLNEYGSPVIDVGHVIDALAKVDAGSNESVMLMSRDAASVLVVSYLDVRRALDNSFRELLSPAVPVSLATTSTTAANKQHQQQQQHQQLAVTQPQSSSSLAAPSAANQ